MKTKLFASASIFALVAVYMLPFSVNVGSIPEAQAAQSDYYLKIDTIEGESMAQGHEKEMQLNSWSFGASNPTSVGSGGMSAGKVNFQDLSVMKSIDKATPMLFLACASGNHIPKATLSVVRPSASKPTVYMTYTFTDIKVTSCKQSADPLMESISFSYAKIEMSYTQMSNDGAAGTPIVAGWNLKANKAI